LKNASSNQELKKLAGIHAADLVQDGMLIGIGTGSTVAFFIKELGRRIREGLHIRGGVPTSCGTRLLCIEEGIPVIDSMQVNRLDLAIDGADEIDPCLNAIKGGGAAHTIEKIVASMSDEFILVADESKLSPALLTKFPLPVEVIPPALSLVKKRIELLGGKPVLRSGVRKDGPVITENGNFVLDINFDTRPSDLECLDAELKKIPGLLETGLFSGIAKKALISSKDGVETRFPEK
jgi:ribose 5-phosphate isomerase A